MTRSQSPARSPWAKSLGPATSSTAFQGYTGGLAHPTGGTAGKGLGSSGTLAHIGVSDAAKPMEIGR
eukprot:7110431-Pyramimonas_sp.AAC.1